MKQCFKLFILYVLWNLKKMMTALALICLYSISSVKREAESYIKFVYGKLEEFELQLEDDCVDEVWVEIEMKLIKLPVARMEIEYRSNKLSSTNFGHK